jgi:hypothetical protein
VNLKPKGEAFATLIAAVVFVAVLVICIRLHVHAYVGTLTLLAVGGAYALARRIARGSPELRREEWTLNAAALGAGQVGDVLRGLEERGYDISIIGVSEAGEPERAANPSQPLSGARLGIRDRRHPVPAAGLTLLLPGAPVAGQRPGFGMVTVVDVDPHEGTYAEMAQYLIATLGDLSPDLYFRRLSFQSADPAVSLRAKLPRSPQHLPGQTLSRPRR